MTTRKEVHQFLPTLSPRDAIGEESLVIQDTLKKMGYKSKIFAENIHPSLKDRAEKYNIQTKIQKDDLIIYHHSIGTNIVDSISLNKSKVIMIYHNITPPEFFDGVNDLIADLLRQGKKQLSLLKSRVDLAVGDSEYNRLELEKLGYKKTTVLPILLDMDKYSKLSTKDDLSEYNDYVNILYVGRIAPNKRVDEVIRAFSYYNLNINSKSNLFLIGQSNGVADSYFGSLQSMVNNAKIPNVYFVTDANNEKLISYYKIAKLFVTMSLHEGFCVPLVESMFFKIPIIAYNSTAIPYTLGNSGVLVNGETFEEIGELFDAIINNIDLKNQIVEKQTRRFNLIYDKDNKSIISQLLDSVE